MREDLPYWVAINATMKFGPRSFERLTSVFDSMKDAWLASAEELEQIGIQKKFVEAFLATKEDVVPEKLMQTLERNNIQAITIFDDEYPSLLTSIYDPPPILFVKGKLPQSSVAHVAIVGSRKATQYGLYAANKFAKELSSAGVIVVSGLAYGIDETAHMATVAEHGRTIAVLASGLGILTSRQNYIANKIIENKGAIISEFPYLCESLKHHFPIRNRIISGISHGTFIVEAQERSGSLITAKSALEQSRDVFALPGPITNPNSAGTNNLIKMGAFPVTQVEDILDLLEIVHLPKQPKTAPKPDSKEEAEITVLMSANPIHIDELIRQTQLSSSQVASTLSLMEMKGRVRHIGGMYYILV
ncbi:DNA-processing protein DprA [Patescibacteria group bacterium]|nr:DNA-processing protein DprA [Patescibacteria group bacterium]